MRPARALSAPLRSDTTRASISISLATEVDTKWILSDFPINPLPPARKWYPDCPLNWVEPAGFAPPTSTAMVKRPRLAIVETLTGAVYPESPVAFLAFNRKKYVVVGVSPVTITEVAPAGMMMDSTLVVNLELVEHSTTYADSLAALSRQAK